jgi:hypothetical protein
MKVHAPTARRQNLATFASVTFVLLALTLLAACSNDPWHVSRQPKLQVDVAAGCPSSYSGYADVVNTYGGSKLVPPGPTGGIVCEYHPTGGPVSAEAGELAHQTRLHPVQATHVAEAVRRLDLRAPSGNYDCPAAIGAVEIIGLSYNADPDVGLWYSASGCKSLDNGRLGSFEGGNPSFYETFEGVINDPSSVPKPAVPPTIVTTPPVTFTIPARQTPNGLPTPSTTVG